MKVASAFFLATATSISLVRAAVVDSIKPPSQIDQELTGADEKIPNANHLFNAIRGAMRQWDSSWNHNGMSFFLASVPGNLQLYHGTHREEAVTGLEWLAFEPEHALGFARPTRRGPPGDGKRPGGPPPSLEAEQQAHEEMHKPAFEKADIGNRSLDCAIRPDPSFQHESHRPPRPAPHRDDISRDHPRDRGSAPSPPSHHKDSPRRATDSDGPCEDPCHDDNFLSPRYKYHGPRHRNHEDGSRSNRLRADFDDDVHSRTSEEARPKQCSEDFTDCDRPRSDCGSHVARPYCTRPTHHDRQKSQQVLATFDETPKDHYINSGFLHIYRTKHQLKLVLIDGMSAGKTSKGTLDSQDYALLLGNSSEEPFEETRASGLCNLTQSSWENRIDGFIRMEAGFEIILCNFSAHLDLERAQPVERRSNGSSGRYRLGSSEFRFYRAVADRFHSIGGDRVSVDYANVASAYAQNINLHRDGSILPRLQNASKDELIELHDAVTEMVISPHMESQVNWQSIADEFVQRYAVPLQYLNSSSFTDLESFHLELYSLLTPFIVRSARNLSTEIAWCTQQFVPSSYNDTLAGRTINDVGTRICSTLFNALGATELEIAQSEIRDLVSWLEWPIWKECPTCGPDEVCVIPIWPIAGSFKDREQPRCKNEEEFADSSRDYWGHMPGGPRGPGDGDKHGKKHGERYD